MILFSNSLCDQTSQYSLLFTKNFIFFFLLIKYFFKKDHLVRKKIHIHIHALAFFFWIIFNTLKLQIIIPKYQNDTKYIYYQQAKVCLEFDSSERRLV